MMNALDSAGMDTLFTYANRVLGLHSLVAPNRDQQPEELPLVPYLFLAVVSDAGIIQDAEVLLQKIILALAIDDAQILVLPKFDGRVDAEHVGLLQRSHRIVIFGAELSASVIASLGSGPLDHHFIAVEDVQPLLNGDQEAKRRVWQKLKANLGQNL